MKELGSQLLSGGKHRNYELESHAALVHLIMNQMTRPGLEPGISGSGGRRLIH